MHEEEKVYMEGKIFLLYSYGNDKADGVYRISGRDAGHTNGLL